MKRKPIAVLAAVITLCLCASMGVAAFATDTATETPLYVQDFESYDGATAVDSWAWTQIGMVCNAAVKEMVRGDDSINGWSVKVGGEGSFATDALAFRTNTLPFMRAGSYTVSFAAKLHNARSVGFSLLNVGDEYIGGIAYAVEDDAVTGNTTPYASVCYDETDDEYTFTFDIVTGGGNSWAYFSAEFGTGGGYMIIDDVTVCDSNNFYNDNQLEPDVSDCIYAQNFSGYDSDWSSINDWLWNGIQWCSDAQVLEILTPENSEESINNDSLKTGQNAAGKYSQNQVLFARAGTLGTGSGKRTVSFDVRLHNVTNFEFSLLKNNTDEPISSVSFAPADGDATIRSDAYFYGATQSDGVWHVYVDAVTSDSDNWATFSLEFGDGGGYMVIDNFTVKESAFDYDNLTVFTDDFESYESGAVADYLWQNTHLYSNASQPVAISDGFDGKAICVGPLESGNYRGDSLFGLKGNGCIMSEAGKYYEHDFEFVSLHVSEFGLVLQNAVPDLGDCPLASISIDPVNKTFRADCAAEVLFEDTIKVRMQYKALGGDIFGYFYANSEAGGTLAFDNYAFKTISKPDITSVLYGSDFEDAELGNFSVETNYYKDEQILGCITADEDIVINGSYSVLAGFDASTVTADGDKWGKLLELGSAFVEGEKYAVTFRFNVLRDSEHYFYLQLGGQNGNWVRFTQNGITEQNGGVLESAVEADGEVKIFTAVLLSPSDNDSLLIGTYGGGYMVIDDLYVSSGEIAATLPVIRKIAPSGEKVFSEGFENQNLGENLSASSYVSGIDVFGTKYAYGELNGKISLVIYSGNDWSETLSVKSGVLLPETVYTFMFRYKKLSGEDANVNFIVRGETEKYIAFSTQGRVRAFTTAGGGFYKDIAVASVTDAGDFYEASVTFKTPAGNPTLCLGMFGVAEIAIDDVTLYKGGAARFDGEAQAIEAPDKNTLLGKIRNARAVNEAKYTTASYAALNHAVISATAVYNNLDASAEEVAAAENAITEQTRRLVLRGDKSELSALIEQIRALDLQKYTDDSVSLLSVALSSAETLAEDEDAVAHDIDAAIAELRAAVNALEEKEDTTPSESEDNSGCGCGSSVSVAFAFAAFAALAFAALLLLRKKEHR